MVKLKMPLAAEVTIKAFRSVRTIEDGEVIDQALEQHTEILPYTKIKEHVLQRFTTKELDHLKQANSSSFEMRQVNYLSPNPQSVRPLTSSSSSSDSSYDSRHALKTLQQRRRDTAKPRSLFADDIPSSGLSSGEQKMSPSRSTIQPRLIAVSPAPQRPYLPTSSTDSSPSSSPTPSQYRTPIPLMPLGVKGAAIPLSPPARLNLRTIRNAGLFQSSPSSKGISLPTKGGKFNLFPAPMSPARSGKSESKIEEASFPLLASPERLKDRQKRRKRVSRSRLYGTPSILEGERQPQKRKIVIPQADTLTLMSTP